MEVGERWAYRERQGAPLVEVELRALGSKRPPRAKIAFVDDEYEGAVDWVPSGRLKVQWMNVDEFKAMEARWASVEADGRPPSHERDAVFDILFGVLPSGTADLYYNGAMGIGEIADVAGLARALGWSENELTNSSGSFIKDGLLYVRWSVSKAVAQRLCALHSGKILELVAQRSLERDQWIAWRLEKLSDEYYWMEADEIAKMATSIAYPGDAVMECLREWCGEPAVDLDADYRALYRSFIRLSVLAQKAAPEVRRLKTKKANALANDLENAACLIADQEWASRLEPRIYPADSIEEGGNGWQ